MPRFTSFTYKSPIGLLGSIIVPAGVLSLPRLDKLQTNDPRIFKVPALWDTGASKSAITKSTATDLGLKPITKMDAMHFGGVASVNVYLISLYLPNDVLFPGLMVGECDDPIGQDGKHHFGVIVGMDVITQGDFAVTNVAGKTTVSFRMPSIKEIDFSKERDVLTATNAFPKVGRNSPCPCGNNKKYKACHGKGL